MRNAQQLIIVGTNGTGKSTFAKKLIDKKVSVGGRALIITNHLNEWQEVEMIDIQKTKEVHNFTGIRRSVIRPEQFKFLLSFHSGLLLFDDARRFLTSNISSEIDSLQISRRQKMLDIVVVAHSFNKIPPGFFAYATHYIMFKTVETARKRSSYLFDIEEVLKVETSVNKKAQTNPHYFEIITL